MNQSLCELDSDLRLRFKYLTQKWKEDIKYSSNLTEILSNRYYQEIIHLGEIYDIEIISLILEDLKSEPDYWFEALSKISGHDPIPDEHRGNLELMTQDWLQFWYRYLEANIR